MEVWIKCRIIAALTGGGFDVSAISRASKVWTATATASHICVVAKPSWKVKLYAATTYQIKVSTVSTVHESRSTIPVMFAYQLQHFQEGPLVCNREIGDL